MNIKILIISLLCFTSAWAQSFKGSVLLGLNASQVWGDNLGGYNRIGITGGVAVCKQISEKASLEMRMMYAPKGSRDVPNYEKGKTTAYYLKLQYIEVPLLYFYRWKKINFMAGCSGGYLLYSSIANEFGSLPENSIENRPFNKYEFCTQYGASYPLNSHWEIECRAIDTFPFLPIRKHASGGAYLLNFGQTNNLLSFCMKYKFGAAAAN